MKKKYNKFVAIAIILGMITLNVVVSSSRNTSDITLKNLNLLLNAHAEGPGGATYGQVICAVESGGCTTCEGVWLQWSDDGPWVLCN